MSMICGLDLHRGQITFDALEVESGEVWRGRLRQHQEVRRAEDRLVAVEHRVGTLEQLADGAVREPERCVRRDVGHPAHQRLAVDCRVQLHDEPCRVVRERSGSLFDHLERLPGVDRIWLPGEQSHLKRTDRVQHGIPMPNPLRDSLDAAARDLGVVPL